MRGHTSASQWSTSRAQISSAGMSKYVMNRNTDSCLACARSSAILSQCRSGHTLDTSASVITRVPWQAFNTWPSAPTVNRFPVAMSNSTPFALPINQLDRGGGGAALFGVAAKRLSIGHTPYQKSASYGWLSTAAG